MTLQVNIPVGQRISSCDKMYDKLSWSNGWILYDKDLIGAIETRWDAGRIFCCAFRKSCFSTYNINCQYYFKFTEAFFIEAFLCFYIIAK